MPEQRICPYPIPRPNPSGLIPLYSRALSLAPGPEPRFRRDRSANSTMMNRYHFRIADAAFARDGMAAVEAFIDEMLAAFDAATAPTESSSTNGSPSDDKPRNRPKHLQVVK